MPNVIDLTSDKPIETKNTVRKVVHIRCGDGRTVQLPKAALVGTAAAPNRGGLEPYVPSVAYAVTLLRRITPEARSEVLKSFTVLKPLEVW